MKRKRCFHCGISFICLPALWLHRKGKNLQKLLYFWKFHLIKHFCHALWRYNFMLNICSLKHSTITVYVTYKWKLKISISSSSCRFIKNSFIFQKYMIYLLILATDFNIFPFSTYRWCWNTIVTLRSDNHKVKL